MSEGMKFDYGKLRFDLFPAEVEKEIVKVLTYGANKYDADNWKLVDKERYIAAHGRHMNDYRMGEFSDPESGIHHLAHAITNLVFVLSKELNSEKVLEGTGVTESDLDLMYAEQLSKL